MIIGLNKVIRSLIAIAFFVSLSSCTATNSPKQSEIISEPASTEKALWVTSDRLNRRSCPNEKCGSVGQLFFRESATVYEEKNGWARITKYYDANCQSGKSLYVDSGNAKCTKENGITDGQFAEWVSTAHLSATQPPDPAANASGDYALVKSSDDYRKYKDIFAQSAKALIGDGTCSASDFQEMGGWMKSITHRNKPIYFTYCGGMTLQNKVYLDASSGQTFR